MKKVYETPELHVFSMVAQDVLTASMDNELDIGELVDINKITEVQQAQDA